MLGKMPAGGAALILFGGVLLAGCRDQEKARRLVGRPRRDRGGT
jgi:hypothetical protein